MSVRLLNNATLEFDDVYVPDEHVLGDVHTAKQRTSEVLKIGQLNSGAIALGNARHAYEEAYGYANERVQGGTEIINHQAVAHEFSEMLMDLEAARSFLWMAAEAVDQQGDAYEPAFGQMAKLFASIHGADVAQRSLEMFGAMGVMFENERGVQKLQRDAINYLHADGARNAHNEVIASAIRSTFKP